MGLGGISIWQLLIVAVIVVTLFGTKKLRGLGGDLGGAIKGFKQAMADEENQPADPNRISRMKTAGNAETSETADTRNRS